MLDSNTASTRNWRRMSRPRAPTASRMPISRVRSVTETSMMFMIPTPPTTSEMPAIEANSSVITPVMFPRTFGGLDHVVDLEVGRVAQADAVPLEEQLLDLFFGVGHQLGRAGGDDDEVDVEEVRALQPLADRGVRGHDDVVLVVAARCWPPWSPARR